MAPIVLNDVQLNGEFAFIFLAAEDAVSLIKKFLNGIRVKGNRSVYPQPPSGRKNNNKDASTFAAARAPLAAAPRTPKSTTPLQPETFASMKPKQALPTKLAPISDADFPLLSKPNPAPRSKPTTKLTPAWLSDLTPLPPSKSIIAAQPSPTSSARGNIVARTQDLSLARVAISIKLNKLPATTTEADIRTLFKDFQLTESEIIMHKSFVFVWLTSVAEAERAMATLDQSLVHGKNIVVKLAGN